MKKGDAMAEYYERLLPKVLKNGFHDLQWGTIY